MSAPLDFTGIDWQDASTATYTAESAAINDHRAIVCLDDEGPLRPAFYWTVETPDGVLVTWNWAPSVEKARYEAVMAALRLA